jgi:hypothetical protein
MRSPCRFPARPAPALPPNRGTVRKSVTLATRGSTIAHTIASFCRAVKATSPAARASLNRGRALTLLGELAKPDLILLALLGAADVPVCAKLLMDQLLSVSADSAFRRHPLAAA